MSVTLQELADGRILLVHPEGKLTGDDYEELVPHVERLMNEHGKIRILFDMRDFTGWEMSALWEDTKFDVKHFNDVERLAMVGSKTWQKFMGALCKPFTTADVRLYENDEYDTAYSWIQINPAAEHKQAQA